MVRECVNCKHSRGLGSDVWCGHEPKGKESYMFETDCEYYEPFEYHDKSKETTSTLNLPSDKFILNSNGGEFDVNIIGFRDNKILDEEIDKDNGKFWIEYNTCKFYDENAERKCLAYDYRDCNQDMADRCKYAKMQSMSKHKGMANEVIFRWRKKSKFGTIELGEAYTEYANVKLNIDRRTFRFIYETFKDKSKSLDEYGQSLGKHIVAWHEENY